MTRRWPPSSVLTVIPGPRCSYSALKRHSSIARARSPKLSRQGAQFRRTSTILPAKAGSSARAEPREKRSESLTWAREITAASPLFAKRSLEPTFCRPGAAHFLSSFQEPFPRGYFTIESEEKTERAEEILHFLSRCNKKSDKTTRTGKKQRMNQRESINVVENLIDPPQIPGEKPKDFLQFPKLIHRAERLEIPAIIWYDSFTGFEW